MKKDSRIYVAGGTGLVGSRIISALLRAGYGNILSTYHARQPGEGAVQWRQCDLTDQAAVKGLFQREQPEYVFAAAARVGGIGANNRFRADFLLDNLRIQNNLMEASRDTGVHKLLFLGSSCIYPRECPQPIQEEHLLTAPLEYTNEPYAVAKIAGMKLCESLNLQYGTNFLSLMPTNLYGPGDNFDLESSHVLPAMIRKFHLARMAQEGEVRAIERDREVFGPLPEDIASDLGLSRKRGTGTRRGSPVVRLWGTGSPRREFMHVRDLARICLRFMEEIDFSHLVRLRDRELADAGMGQGEIRNTHVNIGSGEDIPIRELAGLVQDVVGFDGSVVWDDSQPDGTPRKLLDVGRMRSLGLGPSMGLREGIEDTYGWYLEQVGSK